MRRAFVSHSAGRAQIAAAVLDLPGGDVHVKSATSSDARSYVVKVGSWMPGNTARGLSAGGGAMLVRSADDGYPVAVIEDGHQLTDPRTAAAGAIATDALARQGELRLGIVGTGVQARLQALALASLRPLASVQVWGRNVEAARALAGALKEELGVAVDAAETLKGLVHSCDAITALGADDASKRELDDRCLARAERLFVDSRAQTGAIAEIGAGVAEGAITLAAISGELGELLGGLLPGRRTSAEI